MTRSLNEKASPSRASFSGWRLLLVAGLAIGLVGGLVGGHAGPAHAREPLSIIVTVFPLELLTTAVGGERVRVHTLVPPGASPHTFSPKPSDLQRVARADWFVRVGGGMDDWAVRILSGTSNPTQVTQLVEEDDAPASATAHAHPLDDPHVWLDPIHVRDALVPRLVERLAALDPDGSDFYAKRGADFQRELDRLDGEIRAQLAAAPGRRYIAFHNAWRRFARRYDLSELAVVQEFAGEEPTPRELASLVRMARAEAIGAILIEPQLDPRLARTIASEFDGHTVLVDPLGDPLDPQRASYLALMRFNARAFARALGGGSSPAAEHEGGASHGS